MAGDVPKRSKKLLEGMGTSDLASSIQQKGFKRKCLGSFNPSNVSHVGSEGKPATSTRSVFQVTTETLRDLRKICSCTASA
jgi:hypothetical protein